MIVFDLEIITSPGNGLCNVARSVVDLQKKSHYLNSISTPSPFFRHRYSETEFWMPEEVMIFFLEIDLAAGCITETVARRSGDRLVGRIEGLRGPNAPAGCEFDTPDLGQWSSTFFVPWPTFIRTLV